MQASCEASSLRSVFSSRSLATDSAIGDTREVGLNIILVSDSLAKSRSIALSQAQVALVALGILLAGFFLAMATYEVTMKVAAGLRKPYLRLLLAALHEADQKRSEAEMKENLNARGVRVGALQGRILSREA